MLEAIAVALAGRAGARLARVLKATTSRSSLLRLLMALPDPPAATPRVLGVDDFAVKRGQVYGSVLTDCETGAPVELLEGREAMPLADWLARHPGVQIVCRDRSGAYAEGVRLGAPDAIQVADRWHLWQNLAKATERCVAAHRGCLRPPQPPTAESRLHPRLRRSRCRRDGSPTAPAATTRWCTACSPRVMGCAPSPGTLAGAGTPSNGMPARPPGRNSSTASGTSPAPASWTRFKPYLQQRWEQGCRNAAQLYREVAARGFAGSYALVRNYLDAYRVRPDPAAPTPPTVRQVTGWLTRHPAVLTEDDQVQLKAVLEQCPELRAAAGHVRAFGKMLTGLCGQELPAWIAAVRAAGLPGLVSFAASLEADLDAVTCGLTMRWNSGPIEGRVNHIKTLKRQMFGRARLPLLRKRVLLTAAIRR